MGCVSLRYAATNMIAPSAVLGMGMLFSSCVMNDSPRLWVSAVLSASGRRSSLDCGGGCVYPELWAVDILETWDHHALDVLVAFLRLSRVACMLFSLKFSCKKMYLCAASSSGVESSGIMVHSFMAFSALIASSFMMMTVLPSDMVTVIG